MICASCGMENNPQANFCNACGANMALMETNQQVQKHSILGMASFIIAIFLFAYFLLLILGGGVITETVAYDIPNNSPFYVFTGVLMILGIFISLVGIALGIAGVAQMKHKKIFSVLGLSFNGTILFGVAIIMIVGNL